MHIDFMLYGEICRHGKSHALYVSNFIVPKTVASRERHGVSNHFQNHCLYTSLCRQTERKTHKNTMNLIVVLLMSNELGTILIWWQNTTSYRCYLGLLFLVWIEFWVWGLGGVCVGGGIIFLDGPAVASLSTGTLNECLSSRLAVVFAQSHKS